MSSKALILALIILGGLAGTVLLLPRLVGSGGSTTADSQSAAVLLPIDLAEVVSIELWRGEQIESRAARTAKRGWTILDSQQQQWPGALPTEASQALNALTQVEVLDGQSFTSSVQGVLAITLGSGETIELEFAQSSLGGRRAVRSGQNVAVVEEYILRPLIDPGPLSWRIRAVAPGVRRASRIELIQPQGTLELARLNGRWRLRQPLGARADEHAVEALLDALAALSAQEFLDEVMPDPSSAGLNPPKLIIAYEIDQRKADAASGVRIETIRQELHIGGPASASGEKLFARATGRHSVWMLVSAAGIAAVSTSARNYIEPTITNVLPSDVFRITLRRSNGSDAEGFRRGTDGWTNEQTGEVVNATYHRRISDALVFLTSHPGEPEVSTSTSDLQLKVEIELGDLNGDPLEFITAGYTADGVLGFRNQNLLMLFDDAQAPELLGMSNGSQ